MTTYSDVYTAGMSDERRVMSALVAKFPHYPLRAATAHENIHQDLDCHLGDLKVSIKAQHTGVKYRNLCFELAVRLKGNHTEYDHSTGAEGVDSMLRQGWEPSWYYHSRADLYAILQGGTCRIYRKEDITEHVARHGFAYYRSLSPWRKQYQAEGNHPHTDSICGFVPWGAVECYSLLIGATPPAPRPSLRSTPSKPKPMVLF